MTLRAASPFTKMSFPLNVYAHALFLEEGHAKYLHYGLFKDPYDSIDIAQSYSTELLLQQLPPPPCRILEVGSGLGTTLNILINMGYQIESITPDITQIEYIKSQYEDAPVSCQYFENFSTNTPIFDVILFQESAQYIDLLSIFNQSLIYLKESGTVIIIDEFSLDCKTPKKSNLHNIDQMLALATRFNFSLEQQIDLSHYAAPTLDYILKITQKHKHTLITDLSISNAQLSQLETSNKTYKDNYKQGYYGYTLLCFKKNSLPKWRLKALDIVNFSKLQSLFKLSFDKNLSSELWQWKYKSAQNSTLGVWQDEQLIAHYGGIPRDILYFGKAEQAIQIGDVMVNPKYRGALRRTGPFFIMASSFIEKHIGFGKNFLLGFGFPNARAMQVAQHLKLYNSVGHMNEHLWRATKKLPSLLTTLRLLQPAKLQQSKKIIDSLWQQMADDFTQDIIGIRDFNYIQHRYLKHPEHTYQFLLIKNRYTQKAQGLIITQINNNCCEIIDLISTTHNIPLLIQYTKRFAITQHCTHVICQISNAFSPYLASSDVKIKPLNIQIANNCWSKGPSSEQIKSHWWLMAGDMDFR